MAKITKTLNNILKLIDIDVKRIKRIDTQLTPDDALTLTRYASALYKIAEEQKEEESKLKKQYNKMSTQELMNLLKKESE